MSFIHGIMVHVSSLSGTSVMAVMNSITRPKTKEMGTTELKS